MYYTTKKNKMKEKRYISIDLETTGLDPEKCQILEIGAVIDDWESPIMELPTFHCFVKREEYRGEPYALWLNSRIFGILANPGSITPVHYELEDRVTQHDYIYDSDNVIDHFVEWLRSNNMTGKEHITVAGKNFGSFDLQFLKRLPEWSRVTKFRHRYIDPGNLYWDPNKDGSRLPDLITCLKRAGIKEIVNHTAVGDARQVIKLIRHYFQLKEKR